jgi:hypothetical protein
MATVPDPKPTNGGPDPQSKDGSNRRDYWQEQIARSEKKFYTFVADGDIVIDRFMIEMRNPGDKYNILYSSTETIKPSLYGQTPKCEVKTRQTDTEDNIKVAASMLLEAVGQYCIECVDFDYVLKNCVSDYLLPGLGTAWVRYEPKLAPMISSNDNTQETDANGNPREYKTGEKIALDYVYWKDMRWGAGRVWEELPWLARRVYYTKKQAQARFGKEKANGLTYTYNQYDRKDRQNQDNPKRQTVIWEIWDKENGQVVWYSEDYDDDVLDQRSDYLKLENFFPCPRPIRAVWSTRDFIPKALYSQYRPQAAELDRLTERIRYLTEAIKVRGLYDGSQEALASLLESPGNKMVPVQDWAAFMGQGGVTGVVQWVPIADIATVLGEMFKQREIAKNEIYEITGFSDIVRGVSKASETLGAQEIKADWATGRLKDMQREVQRFCRDIIRIMVEIAAEHFSDKTILLYSGLTIPDVTPQEKQMELQYQQAKKQYPMMLRQAQMQQQQPQQPPQPGQPPVQQQPQQPPPPPPQPPPPTQHEIITQMFQKVLKLIRSDEMRMSAVDIETDSTILPDEEKERQDRMQFLSSMGAFLQQAGPLAMQFPDMRGLLGGIMMFTLRTFSASRPLEKVFEDFQQKLQAMPPTPPPGQGDNGAAAAQSAQAVAQIRAQVDTQTNQNDNSTKMNEAQLRAQVDREKNQNDHQYRMGQLVMDGHKIDLERQKLGTNILSEERQHQLDRQAAAHAQALAAVGLAHDREDAATEVDQAGQDRTQQDNSAALAHEYKMEQAGQVQAHALELADKNAENTKKEE